MGRSNYLPLSAFILLDHACIAVSEAFGAHPYHVGSSTTRPDWRDVDVRLMLPDKQYDKLFGKRPGLWSLLCLSTSEYLSRVSGLPVDFQVQRRTDANAEYDQAAGTGTTRNPLGMPNHRREYAGGMRT